MGEAKKQAKPFDADVARGEVLLLLSAESLKKGIEYAVGQLRAKKVRGQMKLKWMRSLTRQVEALVKVVEALDNIGSKSAKDIDLATFLSSLSKEIPEQSDAPPSIGPVAKECRTAMRRAAFDIRSGIRRASIRRY